MLQRYRILYPRLSDLVRKIGRRQGRNLATPRQSACYNDHALYHAGNAREIATMATSNAKTENLFPNISRPQRWKHIII